MRLMGDAGIVLGLCAVFALAFNAIRPKGLEWFPSQDYQILVPCPETLGEAAAISPEALRDGDSRRLVVDARVASEFDAWHVPGAINVPFDYLEPTPADTIRRIAASGAQEVAVYGDGLDPDSGEQLARELSGKGIRNVSFVCGGAPAMRPAMGEVGRL